MSDHNKSLHESFEYLVYVRKLIEKYKLSENVDILSYIATLLVSIIPFLLLGLIPKSSCNSKSLLMRLLLGFAVGSLLGDTFLHLIPHSLNDYYKKDIELDFIKMCYPIMGGILCFFIIEKIIRFMKKYAAKKLIGKSKKKDEEILKNKKKVAINTILQNGNDKI